MKRSLEYKGDDTWKKENNRNSGHQIDLSREDRAQTCSGSILLHTADDFSVLLQTKEPICIVVHKDLFLGEFKVNVGDHVKVDYFLQGKDAYDVVAVHPVQSAMAEEGIYGSLLTCPTTWEPPPLILIILRLSHVEGTASYLHHFKCLNAKLTPGNYKEKWHHLLWFEEISLLCHFEKYEQTGVVLTPAEEQDHFSIPGTFAECRPSVLVGDQFSCHRGHQQMDGVVVEVRLGEVIIEMSEKFRTQKHLAVNSRFQYSRKLYRTLHEVIETMVELDSDTNTWLFPSRDNLVKEEMVLLNAVLHQDGQVHINFASHPNPQPVSFIRPNLNMDQKRAITNAVRGEYRSHPYLITGGAGTGKTTILVEIAYLLCAQTRNSFMLICTKSDSAATLILRKLVQSDRVRPGDVLRIISKSGDIPDDLKAYCTALFEPEEDSRGIRGSVDPETLRKCRIIVTTLTTVADLSLLNFPCDHFTHLIIDEASQALEPETLIPMTLMKNPFRQLIMAGDFQQIRPIVRWDLLSDWGYTKSLFERLLEIPALYHNDPEWCKTHPGERGSIFELFTTLIYNYRSVAAVARFYDKLFYSGKMKPMIKEGGAHSLLLKLLQRSLPRNALNPPNPNQGVYFLSVHGEHQQAMHEASWINEEEAEIVVQLCNNVQGLGVNAANDVVVLSPYQGQVHHIRNLLKDRGLERVRVCRVEEFSGEEVMMVILSTVRSTNPLDVDRELGLGVLNNPWRTNMTVSRAQCLVVTVGGPILQEDPTWSKVLQYCRDQDTFFDMRTTQMPTI